VGQAPPESAPQSARGAWARSAVASQGRRHSAASRPRLSAGFGAKPAAADSGSPNGLLAQLMPGGHWSQAVHSKPAGQHSWGSDDPATSPGDRPWPCSVGVPGQRSRRLPPDSQPAPEQIAQLWGRKSPRSRLSQGLVGQGIQDQGKPKRAEETINWFHRCLKVGWVARVGRPGPGSDPSLPKAIPDDFHAPHRSGDGGRGLGNEGRHGCDANRLAQGRSPFSRGSKAGRTARSARWSQ